MISKDKAKATGAKAAATGAESCFVWAFLPGDIAPTLCGRLQCVMGSGVQDAPIFRFMYGRSYLGNPQAQALDPVALPLQEKPFERVGAHALWGVFADAMPDDWGRYLIDRKWGRQSPIGYLLHALDDRAGHLAFTAAADEPPAQSPPLNLDLLDLAWMVVCGIDSGRQIPEDLEGRIRLNTALGGARPKLTVVDSAGAQWLAKFPSRRDDPSVSIARIEAAMLDLAQRCAITAAHARVHAVSGSGGSPAGDILLVRRFDRTWVKDSQRTRTQGENLSGWLRDAFVSARTVMQSASLAGVLGGPGSYSGSYSTLAREMGRWCPLAAFNARSDRHELYRRMVFNACIANTDDHDRNHGFVQTEDGIGFELSPAYDMVPQLHGTRRRYQAMEIGDFGAQSTRDNLISAAAAFQMDTSKAMAIIDSIQDTVEENWRECMAAQGVDEATMQRYARCFTRLDESSDDWQMPGESGESGGWGP